MRNTSKIKDIAGQKFNMLTAVKIAQRNPLKWECKCDCGNTAYVSSRNLIHGKQKSCGCLSHRGNPKHNQCYTRVYRIYAKIKRRCFIVDDAAYSRYGGRGITMCDEWKDSFEVFSKWAYANGYKDNLSIDRIDNNGNYCPENCRWVDDYCQSNNRRNNLKYTFDGKTQTLSQWCREKNMSYKVVWYRLSKGWKFEDAITKPVIRKGQKNGCTL